jgi:hypothetical protein
VVLLDSGAWFAPERAERLGVVLAQRSRPPGERFVDRDVLPHEPREVPKAVLDDLCQVHLRRRTGGASSRQLHSRDELDLVRDRHVPGRLDDDEEREEDRSVHDPPRRRVDHDRYQSEARDGIDDGFVRVEVRIPWCSHRLAAERRHVLNAGLIEIEDDRFE